MSDTAPVTVAAVLIVRDESESLETCLRSLKDVVDVIHVHDTGSVDDTLAIARRFEVQVTEGPWTDDFAAARNAAVAGCTADWVLSIDADEVLIADREKLLRELRESVVDAYRVQVHVEHNESPYSFPAVRLFRPSTAAWSGRVHEQLIAKAGGLRTGAVSPSVLALSHSGYRTDAERKARARRNADIARETIAASPGTATKTETARSFVDLGRSLMLIGERQEAADAFEEVRSNHRGTSEWVEATDFLTRLLLIEAMYDDALVLIQQLSESGADTAYCDWLAAQALVQLGRFDESVELLAGVHSVVDTSGRVHNPAALAELKDLVHQLQAVSKK